MSSPSPAPPRASVLLVDDRPDKLLALEAVLAGLGENLVLARSGKEALRCLLQQDFAVILLDVNMPGMDGFETAALIRQRKNSELTPIIFVSALNDTENHLSRGYSLGAVDYILAPIVPEILRAKVGFFVDLFKKTEQVKRQSEERAEFIREQAARAEAEAAGRRAAFLADASRTLAASLDSVETFRSVAALTVPTLADLCLVHTLERNGDGIRLVAVHAANGGENSPARTTDRILDLGRRLPFVPGLDYCLPRVLRTGQSEGRNDVSDAALEAAGWSAEHRTSLHALGVGAYLVVPLAARGRTLGALSLVFNASSGRTYGPTEIALAEELAGRAALAVDSAALYAAAQEARGVAEAANAAKDRFLAMLSHELRTPLAPVLNTVQALEGDDALSPDLHAALGMIRRNVELEARLIDDLLDLTRVSKGKVQLRLETVDAHALVGTALDICRDELQAKGLAVAVTLDATEHHLEADAARFHQVFWNLLKNAVKFTPAEGRLTVRSTNPRPGRVRFEVADTGVGIPPEVLPKVFDAFEQGNRTEHGGLGLGLAITKAIVDLHGGTIVAASPGPDQGTTFALEFDVVAVDLPVASPSPPLPPAPLAAGNGRFETVAPSSFDAGEKTDGRPRVLLVDDHPDTLRSMQLLLRQRGYAVHPAASVQDALVVAAAAGERFDLLVSDVGLPDGSGMDLMRELRARSGHGELPGIALSGYGMEEDVARSHAAGFSDHLVKPVNLSALVASMRRLLGQE